MSKLAWHFVGNTLRDGRPIPADGEWLVHEGPIVICESGLHASLHPFDALQYALGPVLCRVECDGVEDEARDKFVCRRRRIVARADVTETLRYFARMQALSVVHLWDAPDVVLDYLMTGDESSRAAAWDAAWEAAAYDAARNAARDAARWAARSAAWEAAGVAAWEAAGVAARNAARVAARWAARAAAYDAAGVAARKNFLALINEQFN